MQKFGIDISKWQGDFNISTAVTNEGVEFAILKIGGGDDGLYKDKQFDSNYSKCEKAGLPKGCYFFGKALDVATAKKEAEYLITLLKGKKFEYPVFYDVEGSMVTKTDKATLTSIVKTFCSLIEDAGYWAGIYSSASYYNSNMNDSELKSYSHWVAAWNKSKPTLKSGAEVQMWQYGGETNVIRSNKINGQTVDQNYCYVDFPTNVKAAGLNGYTKTTTTASTTTTTTAKKTVSELVDEVIAGEWGNGDERKTKLTAAGYDYTEVQNAVNEKLKSTSKKSVTEIAKEVIAGKWGNGSERKTKLTAAGYDYSAVQKKVNELMK